MSLGHIMQVIGGLMVVAAMALAFIAIYSRNSEPSEDDHE